MEAIEEGIISPERTILTEGRIVVPNPYHPDEPSIFMDWKNHGVVNMFRAIAVSSNVYFFTIGGGYKDVAGLGLSRLGTYLERVGIGSKTGIDLPGEAEGVLPSESWKAEQNPDDPTWRVGDTYNISIGQGGLLVTPLQMARATMAIANGGQIVWPHLVMGQLDENKKITEPVEKLVEKTGIISERARAVALEGMRLAVEEGTAMGVNGLPMDVGAKTGTAEFSKKGRVHSWFIGFLPYQDPEMVLVVNMENGSASNLIGGTFVARNVLDWYTHGGREVVRLERN